MLKSVNKRKTARRFIIGLIVIAIVLGICFASYAVIHRPKPVVVAKHNHSRSLTVKNGKDKIKFTVKADKGLSKDSTPTIAHITGDDTPAIAHITGTTHADGKHGKHVDFYHAISVTGRNSGSSAVRVPAGSYTVRFVTPVNRDGSVFKTSSLPDHVVVTASKPASKPMPHHVPAVHNKPANNTDMSGHDSASKSTVAKADGNAAARSDNSHAKKPEVNNESPVNKFTPASGPSDKPAVTSPTSKSAPEGSSSLKPADIEQLLAKIPANKITNGVMLNVVNDIRKAIEKGDGSLQGDNCKKIVQTLVDNVKANPNVSAQTVDAARNASGKTDAKPVQPAPVAPKPVQPAPVAPKPVQPAPVAPKPKFKTVRVWVPNKVTVVDVPAHTIEVQVGYHTVFSYDGYVAYNDKDLEKHAMELVRAGHPGFSSDVPTWEKRNVPAKTHVEYRGGHWETHQIPIQ